MADSPLLRVEGLSVGFARPDSSAPDLAVEEVSFTLRRGKTLCLVGESGCGKSVTALSIPRLLPSPPARLTGGAVFFEGRDLTLLAERELAPLRGSRMGMIFQDPMTSLNPVMRVGDQISEGLRLHKGLGTASAQARAVTLLEKVGIASPEERARNFPHHLSGGMRQRVMIAMALACDPSLLIADEPTTALDVTVQRQILALMRTLIRETGSGLLLITHNLGIVAQVADDLAVMYAGRIVEQGPAESVLAGPAHPYTLGLLRSLPVFPDEADDPRASRLGAIPGIVPDPRNRPPGCAFHPRCARVLELCRREVPPLFSSETGRRCRCWLHAGRPGGTLPAGKGRLTFEKNSGMGTDKV
ncbi:MAG: ABC transporter ATP-binding protein [Desulfovibrio sp.]|jgi:oligopeptide/dipeptide ABC transporter ATP-binding protein|nr:ABC transporter ATP-binding protein [Desulfovibrio sp.]